jgi:hypothetical protein
MITDKVGDIPLDEIKKSVIIREKIICSGDY